MLFNPSKFLILMLYASTSFMITLAASISWTDPQTQVLMDQAQLLRNAVNDENFWHDSMEAPDHDNRVYVPLPKSKLQDFQQQKIGWREAAENVKKWLNNHSKATNKNDLIDSDLFSSHQLQSQQAAKRNGGAGYICHFKLCQLGAAASNSGKRRWNPYD